LKQWSLRLIELPILRGAAAIHYTAKAEQEEAACAHPDVAATRSTIIPIPVEPAPSFDSSEAGKHFPSLAGRRVILFLSRLHVKKGIELLLPAFAQIHSELPDALLVVAGSGEPAYVETLREKARALGFERDVFWPGFVAGDDKSALLALATLFVLPSFSENFGVAAAEALAAGVPSILSDQVAIAQDAARENAAVIVPCDTAALAAAMRHLLADAALREQLRERGPAFIKNRFSQDAVGRELIALYRSVGEKEEIGCAT
jgi:glycosyltransferase involved in cell wall biosynthesis